MEADQFVIKDDSAKGRCVIAARDWETGDLVVSARVLSVSSCRTSHTFQIGPDTHANFNEPACLINHSCAPNLGIRDNGDGAFDFVALIAIAAGTELTWDYETSEFESVAVPECQCGSQVCRGQTRGYRYLTNTQRANLTHVARYLTEGQIS